MIRSIALLLCLSLLSSCHTWTVIDHTDAAAVASAKLERRIIRVTRGSSEQLASVISVRYPRLVVMVRNEKPQPDGLRTRSREPRSTSWDLLAVDKLEVRRPDVLSTVLLSVGGGVLGVALIIGIFALMLRNSSATFI